MIPLTITPDIAQAPWADLAHVKQLGQITRIGRLPHGCTSGASSIAIVIKFPDGTEVMAQTTMALFLAAARAFKATEDEMSGSNSKN
jgi:hypothetical protein